MIETRGAKTDLSSGSWVESALRHGSPTLGRSARRQQAKVERIAITGRCDCEMCSRGRKLLKPKVKRGQRKPLDEKKTYANVPRAWALLADDEGSALAQAAADAVRAFTDEDWQSSMRGPPALQVLNDWLESRDAKIATTDLTRMVVHFAHVAPGDSFARKQAAPGSPST